jgi:hypothetical protein
MTMTRSLPRILTAALVLALLAPATAAASTWTVDDDHADCPNAGFSTIQAAINQAAPWDTVAVCPGDYAEAIATPNSTNSPAQAGSKAALLITKPLTIRGAGASKVTIHPAASAAPSLAGTAPYLRDGGGAVVQVNRQAGGSSDVTENFVDISGVTITSPDITAEAGIAFFNTSGRISDSVIGPLQRAADATALAAAPHGWGVLMTNSIQGASEAAVRRELTVADSLITGYQSGGILFDDARGSDGNANNGVRSGVREYGYVLHSRIAGSGPDALIAQTGIRFHAGARGSVTESEITGNQFTPDPRQSVGVLLTDAETGPDPSNPAVRAFTAQGNAITGNGFGLFNADIANAAPRLGAPASAQDDWWGCAAGPGGAGCDPVSGPDSASAATVELGTVRATAPAPLTVPGATPDAPPTGAFVDPGEGEVVTVGETVTPTVLAADDFGVKSVAVTLDGAPYATDTLAPYELSWTPGYADIGATHTFVATITDSSGQSVQVTRHLDVPVPAGYVAATLDPLSWDAGTVLVGYEATRAFTLHNSGQNPLAIGTIALAAGAGFSIVAGPGSCAASTTLAIGADCTIDVRFAPMAEGPQSGTLSVSYAAPAASSPLVATLAGNGHIFSTSLPHDVSGTVGTTLGLTVSSPATSLGVFVPGVSADYTAGVALGVTTSTGDASLTIQDPSAVATGHLVNGPYALASPLLAKAGAGAFGPVGSSAAPLLLQTYAAPVVDEPLAVTFKQSISASEPLRTGTYAKTVLFTLSTTAP